MSSREELIDRLDTISTSAAERIMYNIQVDGFIIQRQEDLTFNIINSNGEVVYSSVLFFIIAFFITKCLANNDANLIKSVLREEARFSKRYTDMKVYEHTGKWELYDSAKSDALEALWSIKRITSSKIKNLDKY